ncbi:uncharacterized protein N7459_000112 [Penicillium hispanicum]|uniref:uncharacterized protein n=1 Tax=Penicillium hispanicum TaxID=1080232 RepID=UPI00254255E7|nr:uncharacterized protein N7459_000112 [Penicillium hispanicum]KAJ5593904.1 hypothetical protein N7459_000112 [Penicillium hispanicum]
MASFDIYNAFQIKRPGVTKRKVEEQPTDDTSDRIKDIRKRPRATTPTSGGSAAQPSGGFSSLSPAPAFPSSGFTAPSNESGAFSFGQSQSFPGANSGSNQPAQAGSAPFSFGGPGQTGFNFSSGLQSTNPFTASSFNSNTTPTQSQPSTGFSFGGFGTQSNSQQPSFTFGGSQNANPPASNGLFGQPAATGSAVNTAVDSMQTSPDTKPKAPASNPSTSFQSRSLFGDSGPSNNVFAPKPSAPSSNPFGGLSVPSTAEKPTSDKAEGFAAKPAFATQPPASSTPAQPFGSLFGAPATPDPQKGSAAQATTSTPAQPFANLFGAPPAASKPVESEKITTQPTNSTPAKPFGSLFGATPATVPAASAATDKPAAIPATTNNLFSPKPAEVQAASGNLFMTKPAEQTPSANLFAPKETPEQKTPSTASKSFNSLFDESTGSAQSNNNMFTAKPTNEQPPSGNLFAPKPALAPTNDAPKPAGEQAPFSNLFAPKPASTKTTDAPKPAFSGFSAPSANDAVPSSNPFAVKPPTSQAVESPKPPFTALSAPKPTSELAPFGNLFDPKPAASENAAQSSKPAASNVFSAKPTENQSSGKPQPFGSFFGAPSATPTFSASEKVQPTPAAPQNLFAPKPAEEHIATSSVKPAFNQPSGPLFGAKPTISDPKPIQPPDLSSGSSSLREKIEDQIPKPDLPDTLTEEQKEKAELVWRLQTLDMYFKREINRYQPGVHSFDAVILFYMRVREALGAPVIPAEGKDAQGGPQVTQTNSTLETRRPEQPRIGDNANDSATSNIFAKSFSTSSPTSAKTMNALPPVANSSVPTSTASSNSENMFAKSLSGINGAAPKAKVSTADTAAPISTPASSLAGNMFAKSTSSQGSTAQPAVPKFGNGASGVDFMAQFAKQAEKTAAEEKAKRKAEDFDSEEDDEEEWERRDAEKQREKRAKLETGGQKKAVWVEGEGFKFIDAARSSAADSAGKPATTSALQPAEPSPVPSVSPAPSTSSVFGSSNLPLPNSENIFGRLSATPQATDNSQDSDGSDQEGKARSPKRPVPEEDGGNEGDVVPKSKRAKPAETVETIKSSLDTPLPAPSAAAGRSLFDRVQSTTPQPEAAAPVNPFAAALSKAPLFSSANASGTTTPSDQTWNPNSPIKFSATPTTAPAPAPSSTENASTDAATDEEGASGSIFDLSQGNAGEEEEKVVFECRARAFKLATAWSSQGTGIVRLLQHPGSGRARIVLRADPSGHVILNTLLKKELDYARTSNSVQFMVPRTDAAPEHWAIRVKAESVKGFHDKIEEIKN